MALVLHIITKTMSHSFFSWLMLDRSNKDTRCTGPFLRHLIFKAASFFWQSGQTTSDNLCNLSCLQYIFWKWETWCGTALAPRFVKTFQNHGSSPNTSVLPLLGSHCWFIAAFVANVETSLNTLLPRPKMEDIFLLFFHSMIHKLQVLAVLCASDWDVPFVLISTVTQGALLWYTQQTTRKT